jgi:Domain of unknown function (DUF1851)
MQLIDEILTAWGWTGIEPLEVVGENEFGNLIVKDVHGSYWRICPEDCDCRVVASTCLELDELSKDQVFLRDWHMSALVDRAFAVLGVLAEGRKYCLKIPSVMGGKYSEENFSTIGLNELIGASGHIARQLKDLPDGATVRLVITP